MIPRHLNSFDPSSPLPLPPHARDGLSLADPPSLRAPPSVVRPPTPREPPRLVKHVQMSLPEPQTLVKHNRSSPPEPQTLAKHDRSSLPEPESSIYSSNPSQIQLRSIRSPHEIQTQLKSIRAHFMPTQSRAICSHNLPRLSRSPLIPSHDGSAAAAAAHKSAALSPLRGARHGVFEQGRCSRKLKKLSCLKTTRYKTRRL